MPGRRRRDASCCEHLPGSPDEIFDLRSKRGVQGQLRPGALLRAARFDLVIVDEGHNLKHGFGGRVAARNRVLALALRAPDDEPDTRLFPGYGPRAKRVLFLSATPVEDDYRQLWNQLDVFGLGEAFAGLQADEDAGRGEEGSRAQSS